MKIFLIAFMIIYSNLIFAKEPICNESDVSKIVSFEKTSSMFKGHFEDEAFKALQTSLKKEFKKLCDSSDNTSGDISDEIYNKCVDLVVGSDDKDKKKHKNLKKKIVEVKDDDTDDYLEICDYADVVGSSFVLGLESSASCESKDDAISTLARGAVKVTTDLNEAESSGKKKDKKK